MAKDTKEPLELIVDPTTLPVAPEDTLTEEEHKAADESGKKDKEPEDHLYQPATYYPSVGTYIEGSIESEFDDGTVDVMTALGRYRAPLNTGENELDSRLSGVYPRVEMGKYKGGK